MDYTYQVARLNAIRSYKLIPDVVLQDIKDKSIPELLAVLKEYKYNKIFTISHPEEKIYDTEIFESILTSELDETVLLIDSLLYSEHKWLTVWFKNFYLYLIISLEKNTNFDIQRQIWFSTYEEKIKKLKSILVEEMFKFLVDFENIKLFYSYIISEEYTGSEKPVFLPGGKICKERFIDIFPSLEQLTKYLQWTDYAGLRLDLEEKHKPLYFYWIEILKKLVDKAKYYFFTIEPLVCYFFEKYIEIQQLKKIYFGLKYNFPVVIK